VSPLGPPCRVSPPSALVVPIQPLLPLPGSVCCEFVISRPLVQNRHPQGFKGPPSSLVDVLTLRPLAVGPPGKTDGFRRLHHEGGCNGGARAT
jgi:hypothetical protein